METLHHKLLTIKGQRGFSLIEIVVALVILSTSILVFELGGLTIIFLNCVALFISVPSTLNIFVGTVKT